MNQNTNKNLETSVSLQPVEHPASEPAPVKAVKKSSRIIGFAALAAVAVAVAAVITASVLHINYEEARQKALGLTGGNASIISEEMDKEFLFFNEYSFVLQNDNGTYEVELDPFGNITEMNHAAFH